MSNARVFWDTYRTSLAEIMVERPAQYMIDAAGVEATAARIAEKFERVGLNAVNCVGPDAGSFKRTCRRLGIPHTRKAMLAYVAGGQS